MDQLDEWRRFALRTEIGTVRRSILRYVGSAISRARFPLRPASSLEAVSCHGLGYSSPYSIGWYAVAPDGAVYRYRELYGYGDPLTRAVVKRLTR